VVTNDSLTTLAGTFGLTTLGDTGNCVVLGKQFAMGILASTVNDTGIVLIGKLGSDGREARRGWDSRLGHRLPVRRQGVAR
jgi:hypothetical protein